MKNNHTPMGPSALAANSKPASGGAAASDSPSKSAVSVDKVSKEFYVRRHRRLALTDINLRLAQGTVAAIVGPTGCGKTTLLNMIAGFEKPTSGEVRVNGSRVTGPSPVCGYVPQQANLYPWLSVRKNVLFAALHGRGIRRDWSTRDELNARADEYLAQMGLSDARDLYPYQISGGMRARAAIARVLLANTELLLMDEPFASLDALTRSSLHRLLLGQLARDTGRTLILITHDIEEALVLAQEVYVMSPAPGRIMRTVPVSFGWPRDYDEVVGSNELARQRRDILLELRPFIESE